MERHGKDRNERKHRNVQKLTLQNMSPRTGMLFKGSDMADGFDGLLWCGMAVGCPEAVALETDGLVCETLCLEVSTEALAEQPEQGYPDQDGPVSACQL